MCDCSIRNEPKIVIPAPHRHSHGSGNPVAHASNCAAESQQDCFLVPRHWCPQNSRRSLLSGGRTRCATGSSAVAVRYCRDACDRLSYSHDSLRQLCFVIHFAGHLSVFRRHSQRPAQIIEPWGAGAVKPAETASLTTPAVPARLAALRSASRAVAESRLIRSRMFLWPCSASPQVSYLWLY